MKKKLLVVAIAVILVVTAIAGTSLAYLQDTDFDQNTMTVGNVTIVQNETDREGTAIVYDGTQKLLPAVIPGTLSYDATSTAYDVPIFGESINNELDKFVTVTNTGTEAAYVRTIFAFETGKLGDSTLDALIGARINPDAEVDGLVAWNAETIVVDGTEYVVGVYVYNDALAAGATTAPSLCQIYLDPTADNSFYDAIGENKQYDILVLSQAVQVAGFEDMGAETALNIAFGEVTSALAQTWFATASN